MPWWYNLTLQQNNNNTNNKQYWLQEIAAFDFLFKSFISEICHNFIIQKICHNFIQKNAL